MQSLATINEMKFKRANQPKITVWIEKLNSQIASSNSVQGLNSQVLMKITAVPLSF